MNKRILSLILAMVMVLGTVGLANAASGNAKVDYLVEKGYVVGDEGGLRLNADINRAEVAAMVIRVQGLEAVSNSLKSVASTFKDMNSADVLWARGYVNLAAGNGVVHGYPDNTFKPKNNITYEEVITMLVHANGDIPKTEGNTGHWSLPYITKAIEVGIMEGVTVSDYTTKATRGKVFEMVYNMLIKDVAVEQEIYKGIVVENARVGSLDNDEISFVVFERGNNPANAALRYDKNDDVRITLPISVGDTENLLGKVVDITIDKNNKASKVVVDNSYSYITGPVLVKDGEITDGSGKVHNVFLEDRYSNSIDRIFGAVNNDKQYSYTELVRYLGRTYSATAEFAKVTVKNNSTYFIDSYSFSDIAPVKEIKKSGEEVYIYSDNDNANVIKFNPDLVIGYTSKDGFKNVGINSIKAGDVVHIYDRNKALVRQDAKESGTFDKILESSSYYYAQIDGTKYQIRETEYKAPVYSIDGSKYLPLVANKASADLAVLRNEKITFLLDLNNIIQSIIGDVEFNEGVYAIENISRRNVEIVDANGSKQSVNEEFDSKLSLTGSKTAQPLTAFNRGDIVYLFKDGNVIDELIRLTTAANIDTNAKKVSKTSRDLFDINLANQRTGSAWLRLETLGIISVDSTTNIFLVEVDGTKATRVEGTTLENILDTAKSTSDLRAYVISEKDFTDMKLGNSVRVGNSDDVAHTIIFTDYVPETGVLDYETIRVSYRFNPLTDNEIEGKDIDDRTVIAEVDKYANIPNLNPGDIVTLGLSKDKAKIVKEAKVRIPNNAASYETIEVDRYSSTRSRWIQVKDSKGVVQELFIDRDALTFDGDVAKRDMISFGLNDEGDIGWIIVR